MTGYYELSVKKNPTEKNIPASIIAITIERYFRFYGDFNECSVRLKRAIKRELEASTVSLFRNDSIRWRSVCTRPPPVIFVCGGPQ